MELLLKKYSSKGHQIEYGHIPSEIIQDMEDLIYYIKTKFLDKDIHDLLVNEISSGIEDELTSFENCWIVARKRDIRANNKNELITLVSFKMTKHAFG